MLYAYICSTVVFITASFFYARWKRFDCIIILFINLPPLLIAAIMGWFFLIMRGPRVAQFASGSNEGMDLWSMWSSIWPLLLLLMLAWSALHCIWLIVAVCKKDVRKWIPVIVTTLLLSLFAFVTVANYFPDA